VDWLTQDRDSRNFEALEQNIKLMTMMPAGAEVSGGIYSAVRGAFHPLCAVD
jgi:hypothetical protein